MDDLYRHRERLPATRRSSTRVPNMMSAEELNLRQRFLARQPYLDTEDMLPESGIQEDAEEYPSTPPLEGGDYGDASPINRDMKTDHDFNALLNSVNSNLKISEEDNVNEVGEDSLYDITTKSQSSFKSSNKKRKNKSKLSRLGRLYKELAERMVDAEVGQFHHAIPQSLLDEETFDNSQPISIKDFMSEQRNLGHNREHEADSKNDTLSKVEFTDNKNISDSNISPKELHKNDTKGKTMSGKKPSSLKGQPGDTINAVSIKSKYWCYW